MIIIKILLTGSRKISDYKKIFVELDKFVKKDDTIIHGGAIGVDSIAGMFCFERKIKEVVIKPIYPSKREYYLHRNAEMVAMCDRVIAFWDGSSRGTQFTINYARKRNKEVKVINIER